MIAITITIITITLTSPPFHHQYFTSLVSLIIIILMEIITTVTIFRWSIVPVQKRLQHLL
jgi:hypothetical protein